MHFFAFILFVFFACFHRVEVQFVKKYKCFGRSVYIRNCKVYNYGAPNCFKWDITGCPPPDVRHQETHCTLYTCEEITYQSKRKKVVCIFVSDKAEKNDISPPPFL